ncbi:conserved hypothetical protein [Neospora caninum Liverpool]|nr:conserved hypothetical protein [Neospora caninum Liverpool]CBZ49829.1 conserved hypothetical protein [Neospora caninum Liverpool]|eukprot:XP_003879864.1 conserved hypothetical protein [Neospora caninum Liverpool]
MSEAVELRRTYATQIRPSLPVASSPSLPSTDSSLSSSPSRSFPAHSSFGFTPASARQPQPFGGLPGGGPALRRPNDAPPLLASPAPLLGAFRGDVSSPSSLPSSSSSFPPAFPSASLPSSSSFPSPAVPSSSSSSSSSPFPASSSPSSPLVPLPVRLPSSVAAPSVASCSPVSGPLNGSLVPPSEENGMHGAQCLTSPHVGSSLPSALSPASLAPLPPPAALLSLPACAASSAPLSAPSAASSPSVALSNARAASPPVLAFPSRKPSIAGCRSSSASPSPPASAADDVETVPGLREGDTGDREREDARLCFSGVQKSRVSCQSRNLSPLRFCAGSTASSSGAPQRLQPLSPDSVSVSCDDPAVDADRLTPLVVSLTRGVSQEGSVHEAPEPPDTSPSSFSSFSSAVSSAPSRLFSHAPDSASPSAEFPRRPGPAQASPLFLSQGGLFDSQAFLASSTFQRFGPFPFPLPSHLCGPNAAAASVAASAAAQLPYVFLEFERLAATAVGGAIVSSENLPASLSSFASSPARLVWNNRAASAHVIAAAAHMTAAAQAIALEAQQEAEAVRTAECAATASWAPRGADGDPLGEAGKETDKTADAPDADTGRRTEGSRLATNRNVSAGENTRTIREAEKSARWEGADARAEVGREIVQSARRLSFVSPLLSPEMPIGEERPTLRPTTATREEETLESGDSLAAPERRDAVGRREEGTSSAKVRESREET